MVALTGVAIALVYGAAVRLLGLDEDDQVVLDAVKKKLPARFRR